MYFYLQTEELVREKWGELSEKNWPILDQSGNRPTLPLNIFNSTDLVKAKTVLKKNKPIAGFFPIIV